MLDAEAYAALGPEIVEILGELWSLEMALRARDDGMSEAAERILRGERLNKLAPRVCAALLASLCLDKAKGTATKS